VNDREKRSSVPLALQKYFAEILLSMAVNAAPSVEAKHHLMSATTKRNKPPPRNYSAHPKKFLFHAFFFLLSRYSSIARRIDADTGIISFSWIARSTANWELSSQMETFSRSSVFNGLFFFTI
jgi:hypothetical protein